MNVPTFSACRCADCPGAGCPCGLQRCDAVERAGRGRGMRLRRWLRLPSLGAGLRLRRPLVLTASSIMKVSVLDPYFHRAA